MSRENGGYVISFHPMGKSKFILGIAETGDGETLKIISHRGRFWNVPKTSYKYRSSFYSEIYVSSDRYGRLISVWDVENGLGVIDSLNGRRKFCYSNLQIAKYLSHPQNNFYLSAMTFMKNRLWACDYTSGKILSINLNNSKDYKIFNTGLKSVMFVTKSNDEKSLAVADIEGKVNILRVVKGKLKLVKSISLKSRATAMAWNTRSNGIIIGQENGSLLRLAVQCP